MRYVFVLVALLSGSAFAATGDITGVEISPSGAEPYGACADITISGFTTGKTIDFGSGRGNELAYANLGSATIVFTVVSEGYNSSGTLGTVTRTVYGTKIVRQAYSNHASNQEPSATVIRIALSDFVYDDDNTGAGKSGTAPTVTIAAGAIRNDGGSSQLSNVATNLTCTNSSALDYPTVVGRWDRVGGVCTAERVTAAFTMAARCYDRFGIAGVRFDATGRTSAVNVNSTATTRTKTLRAGSGLYAEAYHSASTAISGFTDDELIDLRFRAYPVVGDANSIIDTDSYTTTNDECLGRNKATVVCDKDVDGNIYGVVDSVSGNNTTGVSSATLATAEASPYLNIGEAIKDGATLIYLLDGTHNFVGSSLTRRTTNEWVVVMPHPTSSSRAGAIVSVPSVLSRYYCERLELRNVTYRHAGTNTTPWGNNQDFLRFNGVDFDKNGIGACSITEGEENVCTYIDNCIGDLGEDTFRTSLQSSDRVAYCIDGTDFGTPSSPEAFTTPAFEVCAVKVRGKGLVLGNLSTPNPAPDRNNFLFDFNEFKNIGSAEIMVLADDADINGVAIVGNVIESNASVSTPIMEIGATATDTETNNIILWHNTMVGERENLAYDGTSTNQPHRHTNWSVRFNCFEDTHTKADVFYTTAGRVGSWPVIYKVGFFQNHDSDYLTNTSGSQDWLVLGLGLTTGNPGLFDDNSSGEYGDGATGSGNGDYKPGHGSVLLGRIPTGYRIVTYDLYGNPVAEHGDVGAIQRTTPDITSGTTGLMLFQSGATTSASGSLVDWSNPTRPLTDNGDYASAALDNGGNYETEYLNLTNAVYPSAVPVGAPSYTVTFYIKRARDTGGGHRIDDLTVQFIDATGTRVGSNLALTANWPNTTAATQSYTLAGYTPDGTEFTSVAGLAIRATAINAAGLSEARVEAAWMEVTWTGTSPVGSFFFGG